ncbi:MAG TPA: 30S ribosomal protein S7 [Sphingobacteriaceae bacterium]|nr:30S ribosomal protein S7 [Sphingobacteriaceae bacterium]
MPRRGSAERRRVEPDPVYGNEMVARFINKLMQDGKKGLAQKIFYTALDQVAAKTGRDALSTFEQAVKNTMPVLEVRPRRVGGSTYQVPMEVRPRRRMSLALRWLVEAARTRSERTMVDRLAAEIIEAAGGTGGAVRRKEEIHRMAEANRAFAHYRW